MFSKENSLEVKGIAIALLLFHHLFYSAERVKSNGVNFIFLSQDTVQKMAIEARVCVWIFAFLSAYGLTCKYLRQNNQKPTGFLIKNWFSLMKSYWFMYIIAILLSYVCLKNPLEIYKYRISNLIFDAFGVADFLNTPMLSNVWWYMCLAQIILVLLPTIIVLCQKFGWLSYPLTFLLMQYVDGGIQSNYGGAYLNYLLVIVLGVLCAQNDLFGKIGHKSRYTVVKILEIFILCATILLCFYLRIKLKNIDIWKVRSVLSSISVVSICWLDVKYFTNSIIKRTLSLLGKHSGNIFMSHALIYTYYPTVIYYTKNVFFSWLTLLAISILVSIILEKLKGVIEYNSRFDEVINMFCKKGQSVLGWTSKV